MTVEELILELKKIKVPARVYFPNMEINQLEPIIEVTIKDKGDWDWVDPSYRYEVVLR